MEEICKKYHIRTSDAYICLDDIASKIIKSKNIESYVKNIKQKMQIGNKYFVTKEKALSIIKNSTSKESKKVVHTYLMKQADNKFTPKENNNILIPFKFNNKEITGLIDDEGEYWFNGENITEMFDLNSYPQDIVKAVSDENITYGENISIALTKTKKPYKVENDTLYVNESGIYELVLLSSLPEADNLLARIRQDVLQSQSLINNGSYSSPYKTETATPDIFHQMLKECEDEQESLPDVHAYIPSPSNTLTPEKDLDADTYILDKYYDLEFKKVELEMYRLQIKEKEMDFEYMKLLGTMEQNGVTIVFEDDLDEKDYNDYGKEDILDNIDIKEIQRICHARQAHENPANLELPLNKVINALDSSTTNDNKYESDDTIDMIEPYNIKKTKKKPKKKKGIKGGK